ncbi:hypothetical protein D9758_009927 [Tetrapyrgos nigripes]|uniref:Uncharacterized protein n=1 Tax=Tetrapyrgos nigripes TaxID=182062 RepID=A0A8H5FRJ7_9AGAR|nr:hypothetical protein D9758_009927 [Tetrapyrgos nigripes]
MPLLGGIFRKKPRSNDDDPPRSNSLTSQRSEGDSQLSSPTSEYVKADSTLPSSPNGRNTLHPDNGGPIRSVYPNLAASSSKLRLGFGRKKSSAAGSTTGSTYDEQDYFRPPRPGFSGGKLTSVASDTDVSDVRRLGPPPSRSAVFAAQDGALSTRSLPDEKFSKVMSTVPPQSSKKRPAIFPWSAKSQPPTTSKATSKQSNSYDVLSPTASNEDSFNLKSFRHIHPSSTELQYNSSSSSLIPPAVPSAVARPRNGSVGSDSGQRISVAAFREAQARRSAAGSPVPSLRSHSPHGLTSLPLSQNSLGESPQTRSRPGISPTNRNRRSSLAMGLTSDSDEEDSSEEGSEDDERLGRRRTLKSSQAGGKSRGRATQSELGHGTSLTPSSAQHSTRGDGAPRQTPSPQSNSNIYSGGLRPRASLSTSALTPTATAQRASVLVAANSEMNLGPNGRANSSSNVGKKGPEPVAQRLDSDSEDDAPLATLVAPRRPGSAMSQGSNHSLPSRPKPLIDINTLTGPAKRAPEIGAKSQAGFTGGNTLLSGVGSSTSNTTSPLASVTSTAPPIRFISPPSSPKHENKTLPTTPSNKSSPQTPSGGKTLVRRDTDTMSVMTTQTSSSSGQGGQENGKKRDNLTERLTRAAQTRIGSTSPSESTSMNVKTSGKFSDVIVIPRTSSPSPIMSPEEASVSNPSSRPLKGGFGHGHRRASSDYTLKLENFDATSSLSGIVVPRTSSPSPIMSPEEASVSNPSSRPLKGGFGQGHRRASSDYTLKLENFDATSSPAGIVVPRTSSPSPIMSPEEASVPNPLSRPLKGGFGHGHRRASSDYTLKLENFNATSPPALSPPALSSSSSRSQQSSGTGFGSVSPITSVEPEPDMMEDIAALLGPGIKLITKNGEDHLDSAAEDAVPFRDAGFEKESPPLPERIAPIVIKQRTPAPSFSVTSRPQHIQDSTSISSMSTSTTITMTATTANNSGASITTSTTRTTRAAAALNNSSPASTKREPSLQIKQSSRMVENKQSTNPVPSSFRKPVKAARPKMSTSKTALSSSSESSSSSSESESESARSPISSVPIISSRTPATPTSSSATPAARRPMNPNATSRPRSSTMSSLVQSQGAPAWANSRPSAVPTKPFALSRESPASSTGDSSSGRLPITPGDGSEFGGSGSEFGGRYSSRDSSADRPRQKPGKLELTGENAPHQRQWSGGASGLGLGKHIKRASVSFDETSVGKGKGKETPEEEEERRKERRRTEAKAAIELGNVINGHGPVLDEDDDLPIGQTGVAANPMDVMGPMMAGSMPMMPGFTGQAGTPGWSPWSQMPPNPQMTQFMIPPPSDPAFFAAHQQAMLYAKQAYQMAVAQQAMAAAAEEWERGSAIGGFSSSQSMYGGSTPGPMMGSTYGMGMGMGGNGWSTGSVIFPNAGRSSIYAMGAQSEYGGGGRGGGWNSSQSVYGESFGPSPLARPSPGARTSLFGQRDSGYFPPVPPVPQQHKTPTRQPPNPRNRAVSQPSNPSKTPKKAPPSSWKAGV